MALVDVIKSCLDSIRQIPETIEGAILYLDAGCTESFQFLGAFPLLLELGARTICSLENMCSLDAVADWKANFDPARKMTVITSCLLSDVHRYILRCLSKHQGVGVRSCTIFTSISEIAHSTYPDSPLGPDAFREYESLLVQDYEEIVRKSKRRSGDGNSPNNNNNLEDGGSQPDFSGNDANSLETSPHARDSYAGNPVGPSLIEEGQQLNVSVRHFPMILCPLTPRVFVLPSNGSVVEAYLSSQHEDSLSSGLPPISTGWFSDADDVPPGAALTAQFLYHLATKMDLKLEIFSLGDLSKAVGKILTDTSSLYDVGRRKRSAGLLLVDRTLDLLTPCRHGDSLVDRILSVLHRRERMKSLSHLKSSQTQSKYCPAKLERSSPDVKIPIGEILTEEGSALDHFQLLERIDAFLSGWEASNSSSRAVDSVNSEIKPLTGSLISSGNSCDTPYLEAILDRRAKDGVIMVKKWLQEALRRENLQVRVKTPHGSSTKLQLQTMVKTLAKSQSSLLRNKAITQLAVAAVFALDESHGARWDAFISAEKMLSLSTGDTSQSLSSQIADIINKSALVGPSRKIENSRGLLSLEDGFLLMVTGYILAGESFPTSGSGSPFSWQEEHFLKEATVEAILENPKEAAARFKFLHGMSEEVGAKEKCSSDLEDDQWESWGDEEEEESSIKGQVYKEMQLRLELRDRVDNLFRFLHKLSSLKSKSVSLREGGLTLESNFNGDLDSSKGLLYKVLTKVWKKYEVLGLEYHSSTMGRLFKSGFGRFGLGKARPSLADQNIVLVFVVGGITALEVREAQEALSDSGRPDVELILGGTTLLTPDSMIELLLGKSSRI